MPLASVMNWFCHGESMKTLLREYENLCTLGLPTCEVVPLAIELLERMLGGSLFGFIWCDEQWQAIDTFVLNPADEQTTSIYATQFYNRREAEVGPTFSGLLRDKIPLINFSSLGAQMFDSALYHEVFRPAGMHHALRATVIDGEHRYGVLAMTRPHGRGFSAKEEALITHAARYLAHAFELERAGKRVAGETTDSLDEGFLVFSPQGQLLQGCELGLRWHDEATRSDGLSRAPSALRQQLPEVLAAHANAIGPSREVVIVTQRGTFVFRPFRLRATVAGVPEQLAVSVRQRSTLAARFWRAGQHFALSSRERQIAVLLALGYRYDDIASHLDVSRNTAVSYVRRTYDKLQVRQREQIVRLLLAPPRQGRR